MGNRIIFEEKNFHKLALSNVFKGNFHKSLRALNAITVILAYSSWLS